MAAPGDPAKAAQSDLPKAELAALKAAIEAARDGQWKTAYRAATKVSDPLAGKIVTWLDYSDPKTTGDYAAISAFVDANRDWPYRALMLRRAEEAMTPDIDDQTILAWYAGREPVSADGAMRLAAALLATDREESARAVLRDIWINRYLGSSQEKAFYKTYHKYLDKEDHWRRLDALIWREHDTAARRMLRRVDADHRALATARILLMTNGGNVDRAIAQVPETLKNDPGLIYERVRWRRKKGRWESASELLDDLPPDPPFADRWWTERSILARRALEAGYVTESYRIAKDHGLNEGLGFAEGEWLAGWIALRFLEEPATALAHFSRMYDGVQTPISLARAAYWCGRAADVRENKVEATVWYGRAAQHMTTYYGQLAAARLDRPLSLPAETPPTPAQTARLKSHELVKVYRLLGQAGQEDLQRTFFLALARVDEAPEWQRLVADFALADGRPDLAVTLARQQLRDGEVLTRGGYPRLDGIDNLEGLENDGTPETPLLLALIRQESGFRVDAISPAGARGLMQLLPSTAKQTAKRIKLPYKRARLTSDPQYNVTLGKAHLKELLERFDGSYVLTLASYNAGPARVAGWVREYGDPRDGSVDSIDWVEMIPFDETRNYVQRILESVQIYRLRLNQTEVAQSLESDLHQ